MAIGADSSQKSLVAVPMLYDPMSSFVGTNFMAKGAILVDKTAKRFCNEIAGLAPILLSGREDKTSYTIFSQDAAEFAHRPASPSDIAADYISGKSVIIGAVPGLGYGYLEDYLEGKAPIVKADTIEELATELGLDSATLKATIEKWNSSVAEGTDPEFNRPLAGEADEPGNITGTGALGVTGQFGPTVAVLTPPFYALQSNSVGLMIAEGPNLIVDKDMTVLDVYGKPIPKLYACGAGLAGGVPILNLQHGEHLTFCIVSARIAAKSLVSV
jgi:fumarate reductase flavoprotein subunit